MASLKCTLGKLAAALGMILFAASPSLPDGDPYSLRTLVIAAAGLLVAIGAYVAHLCEATPVPPVVQ